MIEYRPFHNSDPPQIVDLWHQCYLGRGAAEGFTGDAFEYLIFSQPYFEKPGLIVAVQEGRIVGFVHAGLGDQNHPTERHAGVICMLMVHPKFRRQGIGRNLYEHASRWLQEKNATSITVGSVPPVTPFYVGMYGGAQPLGFLESEEDAAPFCAALGLQEKTRIASYQRDVQNSRDPISVRHVQNRRKFQLRLQVRDVPDSPWWITRIGRLDAISAILEPKMGGEPVAWAECYGLDLFVGKWNARAVAVNDIFVPEDNRKQGYGQTLLLELAARMKRELVDILDAYAFESNEAGMKLLESGGFSRVDTGVVYGPAS